MISRLRLLPGHERPAHARENWRRALIAAAEPGLEAAAASGDTSCALALFSEGRPRGMVLYFDRRPGSAIHHLDSVIVATRHPLGESARRAGYSRAVADTAYAIRMGLVTEAMEPYNGFSRAAVVADAGVFVIELKYTSDDGVRCVEVVVADHFGHVTREILTTAAVRTSSPSKVARWLTTHLFSTLFGGER